YYGDANNVAGSDHNSGSSGNEAWVNAQFKKVHDRFVANGFPVVLGEYAPMIRTADKYAGIDETKHEASRAYWNEVVTRAALTNGCVPFYWETGGDIDRTLGVAKNAYAIDGIMRGKN
ncbi:MAG: cellulase family glycosylhydrolase, partial [Muribaculum sp.]|nr:cellulase family glycosylhydrolase [Muribaculum sp.]